MNNKSGRKSSVILRIVAFAISVYMIFSLCGLWRELVTQQSELNRLKTLAEQKNAEIERLTVLLESGSDSKIIEQVARERLGFVFADEQVFKDISGN